MSYIIQPDHPLLAREIIFRLLCQNEMSLIRRLGKHLMLNAGLKIHKYGYKHTIYLSYFRFRFGLLIRIHIHMLIFLLLTFRSSKATNRALYYKRICQIRGHIRPFYVKLNQINSVLHQTCRKYISLLLV